jgi:hypothetical protein
MDIEVIRIFIEVNAHLHRSVKKRKGVNHQNTVGNCKIVNEIDAWPLPVGERVSCFPAPKSIRKMDNRTGIFFN